MEVRKYLISLFSGGGDSLTKWLFHLEIFGNFHTDPWANDSEMIQCSTCIFFRWVETTN